MQTENLYYTNNKNKKIACDFHYPDDYDGSKKLPTVMIGHGIGGSNKSHYVVASIPEITKAGLIAVTYNLRGAHPTKPDTRDLTPPNMISDLRSASEFVAKHPAVDADNIIAINASYTSNGILEYAAQPDNIQFKGIIAHATVVHPLKPFERKMTPRALKIWDWWGHYNVVINDKKCQLPFGIYKYFSQRNLLTDVAPHVKAPVFLIHGTEDRLGPIEDVRELAKALTASPYVDLREIEGAPHDMRDTDEFKHLSMSIEYSRQAVGILLGSSAIVDENGQPYRKPGMNDAIQHAKVA